MPTDNVAEHASGQIDAEQTLTVRRPHVIASRSSRVRSELRAEVREGQGEICPFAAGHGLLAISW